MSMNTKPLNRGFAFISALVILAACKKDHTPTPIPPNQIRLSGIEMKVQGNSYKYVLTYDVEGRIREVSHESNTAPTTVLFKVSYDANEILLTRPMGEDFDMTVADTIRFTLGGDGNVMSRIQNRFVQTWGSENESRNYIHDTSYFEYNTNGLLLKLMRHFKDSGWHSATANVPEMSKVMKKVELADYTIEGNNLVSIMRRGDVMETTYTPSDVTFNNITEETGISFDYSKGYANKTDFSNAAVLNELHAFTDMPLNKKHSYLPNKVQTIKTRKNKDGVIFSTTNVLAQNSFTFDANGFVMSKEDPSNPGTKVTYLYK